MRDDLHKSAPVGVLWKRFLQTCLRKAEERGIAEERCQRALSHDCKELAPTFVIEMVRLARDAQDDFFGGRLNAINASSEMGGTNTVLEEQILARAKMLHSTHELSPDGVTGLIGASLRERLDARVASICGHVLREGGAGPEARSAIAAVKGSAAAINVDQIAREIISNGGHTLVSSRKAKAVSLDDNLLTK